MENDERAHLESHYQTELESVKNKVAWPTDLLEQLLKAKNGEGTSTQPPATHIPQASQNQGANSANEQHFVPITPIQPTHAPITVDLMAEGTPDNRSTSLMDHDKLFALEERLKVVEGNDWFDPMRATELCWYQTSWCQRILGYQISLSTPVWNAEIVTFDLTATKWRK